MLILSDDFDLKRDKSIRVIKKNKQITFGQADGNQEFQQPLTVPVTPELIPSKQQSRENIRS